MNGQHVTANWILLGALAAIFLVLSIFQAALNSLSVLALARIREEGDRGLLPALLREATEPPPSRLRVSVQVARQLCLIGAALAAARACALLGATHPLAAAFAIVSALFTLTIEQLVARAVALVNPERAFAYTLPAAGLIHYPLLPVSTPVNRVLRWARARFPEPEGEGEPGEEDVRAYLAVGEEEGILEAGEGTLIESVIDFSDTLVREVMTPRTEMAAIPESATLAELVEVVARVRHSRIPVYRGTVDHVVGIVNTRDVFEHWGETGAIRAVDLSRPVSVVPETKRVSELLREFQRQQVQIAIVVDEYGGTAGLVTLEDLLEEIVGEIRDEYDRESESVVDEGNGVFVVSGKTDIDAAGERLGVHIEREGFDTVGGYILSRLGRVPVVGETFDIDNLTVDVLDAERRRVHRVRIRRRPEVEPGTDEG